MQRGSLIIVNGVLNPHRVTVDFAPAIRLAWLPPRPKLAQGLDLPSVGFRFQKFFVVSNVGPKDEIDHGCCRYD